jgi:hypothetical protein
MKKVFFILLFSLFIHFHVRGQRFKASVLAGINSSQVSGDELAGFNKAGILLGGSAILPLNKSFEAEMEILFIQKGSRSKLSEDNTNIDYYKMALNYLEVPIIFTFYPTPKVSLHAGPTVGVLLSAKEEDIAGSRTDQITFENYELGVAGGLSFHFNKSISLSMRLSNSLLPIRKIGADTKFFISGQYNSGLAFFLRYTFNPKSKT